MTALAVTCLSGPNRSSKSALTTVSGGLNPTFRPNVSQVSRGSEEQDCAFLPEANIWAHVTMKVTFLLSLFVFAKGNFHIIVTLKICLRWRSDLAYSSALFNGSDELIRCLPSHSDSVATLDPEVVFIYPLGSLKSGVKTLSVHTIPWQWVLFWTSEDQWLVCSNLSLSTLGH